jgi:hypothetical protein
MDMQVAALDILTTKGRFAPEAARAIGEAMDLQIARSYEGLATNRRLDETRIELKGDMAALEHRLSLKIEVAKTQFWRWMTFAMMSQTAALAGLMRLFMPHGP